MFSWSKKAPEFKRLGFGEVCRREGNPKGPLGGVLWAIHCTVVASTTERMVSTEGSSLSSCQVSGRGDSPIRDRCVYRSAGGTCRLQPPLYRFLPKPSLVVRQRQYRIPARGEISFKDLMAGRLCRGISWYNSATCRTSHRWPFGFVFEQVITKLLWKLHVWPVRGLWLFGLNAHFEAYQIRLSD